LIKKTNGIVYKSEEINRLGRCFSLFGKLGTSLFSNDKLSMPLSCLARRPTRRLLVRFGLQG
jgi:hypothetical protein